MIVCALYKWLHAYALNKWQHATVDVEYKQHHTHRLRTKTIMFCFRGLLQLVSGVLGPHDDNQQPEQGQDNLMNNVSGKDHGKLDYDDEWHGLYMDMGKGQGQEKGKDKGKYKGKGQIVEYDMYAQHDDDLFDYYKGKSQGKGKGKSQFNLAGQVVRILI